MSAPIRTTDAVLVVVDISGYTRFVQQRTVSLQHAEAIVTELIEAIIDRASHPLVVNKLEGDAALLYAETHGDRRGATASAIRQVAQFFLAFAARLESIKVARSHCSCDACANLGALQLKAFVHLGEIVIKQVRQFEEIAGEAVILVHRMTKNSLPLHEYLLMTEPVRAAGGDELRDLLPVTPQRETIDGVDTRLLWCGVEALLRGGAALPPAAAVPVLPRDPDAVQQRTAVFHNLPPAESGWWRRLVARLTGS